MVEEDRKKGGAVVVSLVGIFIAYIIFPFDYHAHQLYNLTINGFITGTSSDDTTDLPSDSVPDTSHPNRQNETDPSRSPSMPTRSTLTRANIDRDQL